MKDNVNYKTQMINELTTKDIDKWRSLIIIPVKVYAISL